MAGCIYQIRNITLRLFILLCLSALLLPHLCDCYCHCHYNNWRELWLECQRKKGTHDGELRVGYGNGVNIAVGMNFTPITSQQTNICNQLQQLASTETVIKTQIIRVIIIQTLITTELLPVETFLAIKINYNMQICTFNNHENNAFEMLQRRKHMFFHSIIRCNRLTSVCRRARYAPSLSNYWDKWH